jgi:hypothetical protein
MRVLARELGGLSVGTFGGSPSGLFVDEASGGSRGRWLLPRPGTLACLRAARAGPLPAVGIASRHAGLIGIEVGFDRAFETTQLLFDDICQQQRAYSVQGRARLATRLRFLHDRSPSQFKVTRIIFLANRRGDNGRDVGV